MNHLTTITIDIARPLPLVVVHAKQNDSARSIAVKLIDNGVAYSVPNGVTPIFRAGKPDGCGIFTDDDITVNGNTVTILMPEQALTAPGTVYAEVNLYNSDGEKLTSFAWQIAVEKSVIADTTIISSDYFNALTALAQEILQHQGNSRYSGTAITGTSTTPAVYAVAAGTYNVGDWYQNSGSGADRGNVYRCTFGGDKDTALWVYEQNYNGAQGTQGNPGNPGADGKDLEFAWGTGTNQYKLGVRQEGESDYTYSESLRGPQGAPGAGVPSGGTSGQVLAKASGDDNDTAWVEIPFGDPNSVSYDAQSGKTAAQKEQARTNIGAAASDHTHGNITNGGAIGTVSDCFLVTGAGGVAQAATPHEAKALLNGGVHVYGVRWDMQNPSSELQRTGDAVGIGEPVPAIGALGGSSPFDQLEPWKSIRECNVLNNAIVAYKGDDGFTRDGTNGDVMIYFPAIYLRTYIESGRYYNIEIADGAKDGFTKIAGRNSFCLGKYKTVLDGTVHVSKTGVTPCASITRAAFRTAARAKGTEWAQQDAAARFALAILYLVEYADFNSQAKIGRGFVDGNTEAALTGTSDGLVYHTGMEQNAGGNGKAQIVYRGVESPWGNVWEFIDGINFNSGVPYICTNPENFADDTATNYTQAAFTCAQASGWQKTLARDANIQWLLLPSVVGGSETSFVSDHYWYDAGWRLALAGGDWNDGSDAGLLAWAANDVSSFVSAYVGSRLLFLP